MDQSHFSLGSIQYVADMLNKYIIETYSNAIDDDRRPSNVERIERKMKMDVIFKGICAYHRGWSCWHSKDRYHSYRQCQVERNHSDHSMFHMLFCINVASTTICISLHTFHHNLQYAD